MASRNGKRNGYKQRKLLDRLYREHKGKCQKCNKLTKKAYVLLRLGYTLVDGYLVRKTAKYPVATVEHIHPLAYGGRDGGDNVTLFCWQCNQEAAKGIRVISGKIGYAKRQFDSTSGFNPEFKLTDWEIEIV